MILGQSTHASHNTKFLRSIENEIMKDRILINPFAMGFKWLQSPFTYNILFTGDLNFSTRFTKNVNITGTKED